ncbi:DUF6479 family protein [Streptomyces sp. NPDC047049]|uniref:DUF6479 family protein n=1 Tax=Streptomyces sp. NPDC047049 TaxID=3156688 RepID=UPI0033DFC327
MAMSDVHAQVAARSGASSALLTIVGVLVVVLLIGAFAWGRRARSREPGPPRPEEQPRLPHGSAAGDVVERREPDDLPRTSRRRKPHELKGNGIESRPASGRRDRTR